MKVIVSSETLALTLKKMDLDNNPVNKIASTDGGLIAFIHNDSSVVRLHCEVSDSGACEQNDARWDWVRDLVNSVPEQPIVLDIQEQRVKVIFEY